MPTENGDGIIELPDEWLKEIGLGVGDSLYLTEEYVGTTRCLVLSKTPRVPQRVEHRDNDGAGQRDE